MRRFVFALLLVPSAAFAQYTYIVPVAGAAFGFQTLSFTWFNIVNPRGTAATVRYEAVYPLQRPNDCTQPLPEHVAPHAMLFQLSGPCFRPHAFVLSSDQPVEVTADVVFSIFRDNSIDNTTFERMDIAKDWLPAGTDVLIPLVRMYSGYERANLFLINPNDVPLTVNVRVERAETPASRDLVVRVEPQSLSLTAVPVMPGPKTQTGNGIHNLTLRADGKFYAVVSNVLNDSAVFRAPIPLQP